MRSGNEVDVLATNVGNAGQGSANKAAYSFGGNAVDGYEYVSTYENKTGISPSRNLE